MKYHVSFDITLPDEVKIEQVIPWVKFSLNEVCTMNINEIGPILEHSEMEADYGSVVVS